jgi:hypothetical protein
LLNSLGLLVNEKKCIPPARKLTFLGVVIDCHDRTLALPEEKLGECKILIKKWLLKKRATEVEIQRLAGKLNLAARVVRGRGGRTFLRRILDLLSRVRESHHHVHISVMARQDISWWDTGLDKFHVHCKFACDEQLPNYVFASDACLEGGGAHYFADWFYVAWEADFPELLNVHINVLELFTVFLALCALGTFVGGGSHLDSIRQYGHRFSIE